MKKIEMQSAYRSWNCICHWNYLFSNVCQNHNSFCGGIAFLLFSVSCQDASVGGLVQAVRRDNESRWSERKRHEENERNIIYCGNAGVMYTAVSGAFYRTPLAYGAVENV